MGGHGKETLELPEVPQSAPEPEPASSPNPETQPFRPAGGARDDSLLRFEKLGSIAREHYAVMTEIGRGGQGRVVRARDLRLERTVALKESLHQDETSLVRFAREAFVTARLEHPAIIPVHEAGWWADGVAFYAMKHVSGRGLDALMAEKSSLEERVALLPNVLIVAEAIAYAHSRRVVHRDIKPANILIGEFGETVVIDWGLAKDLDARGRSDNSDPRPTDDAVVEDRTVAGDIVGTPAYMPPEQARGSEVQPAVDVYALGAVLYHLIAGQAPYANRTGRMRSVLSGPPDPLGVLAPAAPRDLVALVEKAMAPDPTERYLHAGELAEDLRRFLTGRLVEAHRYSRRQLLWRWGVRHRAPLLVAGALLTLLALFAAFSVRRIVQERDGARTARNSAEAAEAQLRDRNNALVLFQARAELDRDPTLALAWLKTYPPSAPDWRTVSEIASDAWTRGVARHVWRAPVPLTSLAFSPDGRSLAAGAEDNTLRVWDLSTARARTFEAEVPLSAALRFSPDGRQLASANGRDVVTLIDLAAGTRKVFRGVPASSVTFAPDGSFVLATGVIGSAAVCELATGAIRRLTLDGRDPFRAALMPDGKSVAMVEGDTVWLVTLANDSQRRLGTVPHANGVVVSPNGEWIAVPRYGDTAIAFNSAGGAARQLKVSANEASSGLFAPDGALFLYSAFAGLIRWNIATGESVVIPTGAVVHRLAPSVKGPVAWAGESNQLNVVNGPDDPAVALLGHQSTINDVAVSGDGKWIASASADHTLRLWERGEGDLKVVPGATGAGIFSPDQRTVLTMDRLDHAALVVDVATGRRQRLTGPRNYVWAVGAFRPHTNQVLVSEPPNLTLVTLPTLQRRTIHPTFIAPNVLDLSDDFSPDGSLLSVLTNDGVVSVIDVERGERRVLGRHDGKPLTQDFSADGRKLLTGGRDNVIKLWDLEGGAVRTFAGHSAAVLDVAFSPSGTTFASASDDSTVRIWNLATGSARILNGHSAAVRGLDYSPDGARLLSVGVDHTVRLWNLATGESRIVRRDAGTVWTVRFEPEGHRVLTSGDSGRLWFWDLDATPGFDADPSRLRRWIEHETSAEADRDGRPSSPLLKQ